MGGYLCAGVNPLLIDNHKVCINAYEKKYIYKLYKMSEDKIKNKIRTAFSKLTDLTKSEEFRLHAMYSTIKDQHFNEDLLNDLTKEFDHLTKKLKETSLLVDKYDQKLKETSSLVHRYESDKKLFEAFIELMNHYRSQMYGGGKRKSRKTNRKPLRKRKNTLTKRRYRK